MLKIRREQMRVLGEAMQRQFEVQMLLHLRSAFADQTQKRSDAQLTEMIRHGIAAAEKYEVDAEKDVARYIEYMALYGADFDQRLPWAGEVLRTKGINGTQKMERIDRQAVFARPEILS